jgi:hypothetical protein
MENKIKLQKNNDNRDWSDVERIQEFHDFLQGEIPNGMYFSDDYKVNLTPEQSSAIIWYLQEHFPVFPDSIEMCDDCKRMYDSDSEGCYYEIEGKHYCGACEDNSEAVYCDECMTDMWKKEGRNDDGMYYCDECKIKKQD